MSASEKIPTANNKPAEATCPLCGQNIPPSRLPLPQSTGEVRSFGLPLDRPALGKTLTLPADGGDPAVVRRETSGDSFLPQRIGRFTIKQFLGEGAFGWVYEAFDPTLKRVVALKVAKPQQVLTSERVE